MTIAAEEYVTVDEAAALLRVAPSTIRRWVREGALPAYRVGRRRLALRRADLDAMVTPARVGVGHGGGAAAGELPLPRRLTPEERERGLEIVEELRQMQRAMLDQRGGVPFPPLSEPEREETLEEVRQRLSRRRTPEERERALAAMERLKRLQEEVVAERGGEIFSPPSWVLINEARDERTHELS